MCVSMFTTGKHIVAGVVVVHVVEGNGAIRVTLL